MRLFFIVVIFGLISSGCSSAWYIKKARQKCPECFETTIVKKDTTIKIDTTFYIDFADYIELDTTPVIKYDTIYQNNVQYLQPSFDTIIDVSENITAKIWMINGRLGFKFDVASTLPYHLQDSIKIPQKTEHKTEIIQKETNIKQYFIYIAIILGLVLLIFIFKK